MPTNEELYAEHEKLKAAGDLEGAVKRLEEIVAQDPGYALAHSALAVTLGRLGRHPEAIEHAKQVCEIEPNDPFSYTALSVTYQRAGHIPEAEDALARAHMLEQRR